MDTVAAGQYKDPLHNLQPPTSDNNHYITNILEDTAHDHQAVEDAHPQLRFCSTSCWCLLIGVTIACGSIAMTACSYFADALARESFTHGNVTEIIVNDELRVKLTKFKTIGPILIGLGIFCLLCACVLLCEARDRLKIAETECEKILPIGYDVEESYKTAESIRAETLAITPGFDLPMQSSSQSQESESSGSFVNDAPPHEHDVPEELPYEGSQGSPVVLIHGTTSSDDTSNIPSLPVRTDSLKRPKEADGYIITDGDIDDGGGCDGGVGNESSPKRPTDGPLRKLQKLEFPPQQSTSPNKSPRLLELSPSKLPGNHVNNNVFPKPLVVTPVKLPPSQHNVENGSVVVASERATGTTGTSNQMLQTDFPSPCSSCEPSPVKVPRQHQRRKSALLEAHPDNIFLLENITSPKGDTFSSNNNNSSNNNSISSTVPNSDKSSVNGGPDFDEASSLSSRSQLYNSSAKSNNQHQNNDTNNVGTSCTMETCLDDQVDNINVIENRLPTASLCNVSQESPTHHQQQTEHVVILQESEHDSSQRDTNSNITGSTASVHSHNSNQSPNRTVRKREIVLV